MPSETRRLKLQQMCRDTPIFQTFGLSLEFGADDLVGMTMPYNPALDQGMGVPHGGVYATILDATGWFASAAAREGVDGILTSEISVHFLRAARESALHSKARILKQGRSQDVVEISVFDATGKLVGHATGTYVILGQN